MLQCCYLERQNNYFLALYLPVSRYCQQYSAVSLLASHILDCDLIRNQQKVINNKTTPYMFGLFVYRKVMLSELQAFQNDFS